MFQFAGTRSILAAGMVAAVLLGQLLSADRAEPPSAAEYSLDTPPMAVAGLLGDLTGTNVAKRKAAGEELAKLAEAEPYLRTYRATKAGMSDGFAGDALEALEEDRAKRNLKRVPGWAKEGRYDLLVDVSLHLTTTEQANEVGQPFFDFADATSSTAAKLGGPNKINLLGSMAAFSRQPNLFHIHEKSRPAEVQLASSGYVRAQSCEASASTRFKWLVLTRNHLKGTHPRNNQWEDCYLFHNSDLALDDCMTSLVVCDGDVELVASGFSAGSVLIANGSIRSKVGIVSSNSLFFAHGDIALKAFRPSDGVQMAGGRLLDVKTGKVRPNTEHEKSGVKENPFGVRFFQTADVGVELATKGAVVSVAKLTPGSPLTKYDLQVGDIITQVNDKPAKTANDVRRELRYSVALEAGIFHIRRGDEKLTRVVYFKNGLEK